MSKFGQRLLVYAGLVVLTLAAVVVPPCMAQTNRGTITGTVTDPSGAVVSGAAITASNTGTNVRTYGNKRSRGRLIPSRSCRWDSTM